MCNSAAVRVGYGGQRSYRPGPFAPRRHRARWQGDAATGGRRSAREIRKRFPGLLEYDVGTRRYVLLKGAVEPIWLDVSGVRYAIHAKPGSPDAMRVEYSTGVQTSRQWVLFAHSNIFSRGRGGLHLVAQDGRRASCPGDGTRGHRPGDADELRIVVGVQLKSERPIPGDCWASAGALGDSSPQGRCGMSAVPSSTLKHGGDEHDLPDRCLPHLASVAGFIRNRLLTSSSRCNIREGQSQAASHLQLFAE